jgi:hypothetical protein
MIPASSSNYFDFHEGCPRHGACAWVLGFLSLCQPSAKSENCHPACREYRGDRTAAPYAITSNCHPDVSVAPYAVTSNCHPDRSAAPYAARSGGISAPLPSSHRHRGRPVLYPSTRLMLFSIQFSRSGGTGRRSRLKICRGSLPVWVRLTPPGPFFQADTENAGISPGLLFSRSLVV